MFEVEFADEEFGGQRAYVLLNLIGTQILSTRITPGQKQHALMFSGLI